MILFTFAFCLGGVFLLKLGMDSDSDQEKYFLYVTGCVEIMVFGSCAFFLTRRLISSTNGIIMTQEGLVNGTTLFAPEYLKWNEIILISENVSKGTKAIIVEVTNPQDYISNARGLKAHLYKQTFKQFNTPISIATKYLSIEHDQLLHQILEYQRDLAKVD